MRSREQFERILGHDLEPPDEPTAGTRQGTIWDKKTVDLFTWLMATYKECFIK